MSELQQTQQQIQKTLSEARELALENYRLRKSGERANAVNQELMGMITDFFGLEANSNVTVNDVRELFNEAKSQQSGSTNVEELPKS